MAQLDIATRKDFKLLEENLLGKIEEKMDSRLNTNIKIYTSADLEMLLKITANTVKKYREEGLTFIRISNGEYRYSHDDIVKFLSKNKYNYQKNLL